MDIEFEAKFPDIDKDKLRKKLKALGAVLVKPEFFQKRIVFFLPKGHEIKDGYLRVRDEGDRITMSLKVVNGDKIYGAVDVLINKKYGVPYDVINNETPRIIFGGENPWSNWLEKNKK